MYRWYFSKSNVEIERATDVLVMRDFKSEEAFELYLERLEDEFIHQFPRIFSVECYMDVLKALKKTYPLFVEFKTFLAKDKETYLKRLEDD